MIPQQLKPRDAITSFNACRIDFLELYIATSLRFLAATCCHKPDVGAGPAGCSLAAYLRPALMLTYHFRLATLSIAVEAVRLMRDGDMPSRTAARRQYWCLFQHG